jgi:hypothetical protein
MGVMSGAARNPFVKIDKQSVIGALKATGSRDADVLYTQKNELLTTPKSMKTVGMITMVIGGLFTVMVILAWAGIPFAIFGWWLWSSSKKNIATINAGYDEYVASLGMANSAAV